MDPSGPPTRAPIIAPRPVVIGIATFPTSVKPNASAKSFQNQPAIAPAIAPILAPRGPPRIPPSIPPSTAPIPAPINFSFRALIISVTKLPAKPSKLGTSGIKESVSDKSGISKFVPASIPLSIPLLVPSSGWLSLNTSSNESKLLAALVALPVESAKSSIKSFVPSRALLNLVKSLALSFCEGRSTLSGSIPLKDINFLNILLIASLSLPKPPERPTINPVRAISNAQNGCAATNVSIADKPARALDIKLTTPTTITVARALTLKATHIAAAAASIVVRIFIAVALRVTQDTRTDNALSTVVRIGANALNTLIRASRTGLSKPPKAPTSLTTA